MYTQQVYALLVTHIDGENMVVSWSDQTNSNIRQYRTDRM